MPDKKIGWQKYESALEEQWDSPLIKKIMEQAQLDDDMEAGDFEEEGINIHAEKVITIPMPVPIPPDVASEVALTTNFDCWIGHCNFELMDSMKDKINKVGGVELLQIRHKHRFFIGLGKMFSFTDVRKAIEDAILE
jgi:hypothetical protein|tara:strand:- start:330 stop:740 length:411 start_codon:yes stop_codon:yes gene_type:complete